MALTGNQAYLPFKGRQRFWWSFTSELESMVAVGLILTIPVVPTVATPTTGVIAETPVAPSAITLTIPAIPTVAVSTQVT